MTPSTHEVSIPNETFALFQQYADRPFVFVRPGGNAGDQLIYMGAEKLGRKAEIDFATVTYEAFMQSEYSPETVVYLHGGGGYNPIWSGKPMEALQRAASHAGVVIQGPQTYWDDLDFLRDRVVQPLQNVQCERLVLMTRERVSYDLLKEVLPSHVDLLLDHDTALNLQREDLEALLPRQRSGYKLFAIREDKEANAPGHRAYFAVWRDAVRSGESFEDWLRLHAGAKEIVTNRLHSSICGSILGIPTTLLPNSYFKNRAVWERSLSARGVRWADQVEVGAASELVHRVGPARRLLRRSRVQRLVQRFHGLN